MNKLFLSKITGVIVGVRSGETKVEKGRTRNESCFPSVATVSPVTVVVAIAAATVAAVAVTTATLTTVTVVVTTVTTVITTTITAVTTSTTATATLTTVVVTLAEPYPTRTRNMIDKTLFALPGIRKVLSFLSLSAAVQAAVIIGQSGTLSAAITNLRRGEVLADQLWWLVGFLVCFITRQVVRNFQETYLDRYAYKQADSLRDQLMLKIFSSKTRLVQEAGTGSITTAAIEGIDQIETYLRLILPKMTGLLIIPLIILLFVVPLDWVSGLIMCVVFPFIILYMLILGRNAKDKANRQHKSFQIMSNHFIDSLRGIKTLKLFGVSKQHGASIYETSERFREASIKTIGVATLSSFLLDLFSTLSIAAVAFMLGMRLLDGTLGLFPALFILILAPEYFKPLRDFAGDYHASLEGKNSLSSVQKIISSAEIAVNDQNLACWEADSLIAVRDLHYSYPNHKALSALSFQARGYQKIGIIGASGSGKSTLIKILSGLATPEAGEIALNGEVLDSLNAPDWHTQVISIPQDPYIFHATLHDNLCFYHPEADERSVQAAIEVMGLQQLVEDLPEGLDTHIGEGARALSGGQAQRIALARSLLDSSRKVLLFDEPTAHLDIETERELKEKMLPLMRNRLVFFATHRLHWMHDMDYLLVMDQGEIVEQGSLSELLRQGGRLSALAAQVNHADESRADLAPAEQHYRSGGANRASESGGSAHA